MKTIGVYRFQTGIGLRPEASGIVFADDRKPESFACSMNTKLRVLLLTSSIALTLSVISPAPAGESPNAPEQDAAKAHNDAAFWAHLATARKATELIGLPVSDRPGHPLGQIADLVVDLATGRVACALDMPVGEDGAVNGYIPVPAPTMFLAGKAVTLTADKSILADVPRLSPGVTDPAEIAKAAVHAYAYFNLKFLRDDQAATLQLWKTSRLLGRKLKNKAGDNLGSLANFMVDLRSGHIFFAIGTMDGTEKNVYAVPTASLVVDRQEPTLWLESNRSKIAETSNSDGFFWTSVFDPAWGSEVYRTFKQAPNSEPGLDAKDEKAAAATPAGPSDAQINETLMNALGRDSAYRNIAVMISSGQVTLQGKVKNEALKQKIGALAESVAGAGKVNNLLMVGR